MVYSSPSSGRFGVEPGVFSCSLGEGRCRAGRTTLRRKITTGSCGRELRHEQLYIQPCLQNSVWTYLQRVPDALPYSASLSTSAARVAKRNWGRIGRRLRRSVTLRTNVSQAAWNVTVVVPTAEATRWFDVRGASPSVCGSVDRAFADASTGTAGRRASGARACCRQRKKGRLAETGEFVTAPCTAHGPSDLVLAT